MEMISTTPATTLADGRWAQLQSRIQGTVISPEQPQYHDARQAWNLAVDQYPAVIVVPRNVTDVMEAVRFATHEKLGIAVQATGHGNMRPANDSLLILTAAMNEVRVDAASQTAWVESGAKWEIVLARAQAVGLAPLLGSTPDVSAVGYTLGGGMGWLARKYGLSADSVNLFELVTADGRLVHASEEENSDLFWGLRGGGGSLGVVTGMEIKLYPVTTVYGGNLYYPIDQAKEVFTRYRDWIKTAPDELTSSILVMNFPPIPDVPEFLRGQTFAMVRGCYVGPVAEGEALLQSWRDWQAPLIDDFKEMSFSDVALISNDPVDPLPSLSTGVWLRELNDDALDALIRFGVGEDGPSPLIFAEVRHAGGAIARVNPQANAYGNRDANHILQLVGVTPTPESHRDLAHYTDRLKQALRPVLTGGVYLNFLEGTESQQRIKDGYLPETYQKLTALKAKYDPGNLLRFSFNIPPAR